MFYYLFIIKPRKTCNNVASCAVSLIVTTVYITSLDVRVRVLAHECSDLSSLIECALLYKYPNIELTFEIAFRAQKEEGRVNEQ